MPMCKWKEVALIVHPGHYHHKEIPSKSNFCEKMEDKIHRPHSVANAFQTSYANMWFKQSELVKWSRVSSKGKEKGHGEAASSIT